MKEYIHYTTYHLNINNLGINYKMTATKYKVLIIAPSWVGDMVMAQTLFKMLKQQYQNNLQLDILANSWAKDILNRMPEVDNIINNPFKHGEFSLWSRIKFGLQLRSTCYDQAFILPNSFKSAIIPFAARIKKRTGFIGEMRFGIINDIYKLNKIKLPLMIDRFCALANNGEKPNAISNPNLIINHQNQLNLLLKFKLNNHQTIAFCPAAEYGPAKRWPPIHFANLANLLINKGYQIIILGSQKDRSIAQQIIKFSNESSQIHNLCGKTSLADTVDLLAICKYAITNDSGLMHIAAATGTKLIAIYGSSSPNFTPPLSINAQIVQIKLPCSPCFQRTCKYGHYNCLTQITADDIITKIT